MAKFRQQKNGKMNSNGKERKTCSITYSVHISRSVLEQSGLSPDDEITVNAEQGKIIIQKSTV